MATTSFDWVADDLAVGGRIRPDEIARLRPVDGVDAVVDLRAETSDDPAVLGRVGLTLLRLPTVDRAPPSPRDLARGLAFAALIRRRGGRLLVHCEHGVGRSATLALAILVDRGHAPLDALERMKTARWQVSPSPAQFDALAAFLLARPEAGRAWDVPPFDAFAAIAYRHMTSAPS